MRFFLKSLFFTTAILLLPLARVSAEDIIGCCMLTVSDHQVKTSYFSNVTRADCEAKARTNTHTDSFTFNEGMMADQQNRTCIPKYVKKDAVKPALAPIVPKLSVSIPGFTGFSKVACDAKGGNCSTPWLADYIKAIYNYGLIILGVLSVIVMMVGGVIRLTAGGNHEQINHGNTFIKGAIMGVTLALCSYTILFLLNPNLLILSPLNVSKVQREELEDLTEPVDIASLKSSPQSGEFSLDPSSWQVIPKANGLCMASGAKATPRFIAKMKEAGECLYKINPKWCIAGTGARSIASQEQKFKQNCHNGSCNPPTCNPYPLGIKICPHTSGSAADLETGSVSYAAASKCLKAAGLCRLCSEAWHWEYPKMSSNCNCE